MVYPTTLIYIDISFAAGLEALYFGWIYISINYEFDLFHSRAYNVKEHNAEASDSFLCMYITLLNKVFPLHLTLYKNITFLLVSCKYFVNILFPTADRIETDIYCILFRADTVLRKYWFSGLNVYSC
jgi:hypothetical protein